MPLQTVTCNKEQFIIFVRKIRGAIEKLCSLPNISKSKRNWCTQHTRDSNII